MALSQDHSSSPRVSAAQPIVDASGVDYTLEVASQPLHILKNVSLRVEASEVAAIVGPSGRGKTSLLMLLAGLERATSGKVVVAGQDLSGLSEDDLAVFRRHTLGIVFQSFHLIPSLTALANVGLALEIAPPPPSPAPPPPAPPPAPRPTCRWRRPAKPPRRRSRRSGSAVGCITGRRRCRVASSSALAWPAP